MRPGARAAAQAGLVLLAAAASFVAGRGSAPGIGTPGASADAAVRASLAPGEGGVPGGAIREGTARWRSVASAGASIGASVDAGGRHSHAAEQLGGAGAAAAAAGSGGATGGPAGASERAELEARYAGLRTAEEELARDADRLRAAVPSLLPVEGARVSSAYTSRRLHPVLRRVLPHRGVDLAAPHGAPVRAAADGVVLYVVRHREYGLVVDVAHGERFITRYAHLSAADVERGDTIPRGEVIGRVGSSGLSTGPHLHYETFVDGRRRDPIHFLGLSGDLPDVP